MTVTLATALPAGAETIKRVIPHRYPILLVDRVIEVVPGQSLVAHKAVSVAEPCYQHVTSEFAEAYAYPAGLLLESWAQCGALLACWTQPNPDVVAGKVELAAGLKRCELLAPVYPGDLVEHRVEIVRQVDEAVILTGTSTVRGTRVLSVGQITMALRPVEVLL